jgi:hypothetical protein
MSYYKPSEKVIIDLDRYNELLDAEKELTYILYEGNITEEMQIKLVKDIKKAKTANTECYNYLREEADKMESNVFYRLFGLYDIIQTAAHKVYHYTRDFK